MTKSGSGGGGGGNNGNVSRGAQMRVNSWDWEAVLGLKQMNSTFGR